MGLRKAKDYWEFLVETIFLGCSIFWGTIKILLKTVIIFGSVILIVGLIGVAAKYSLWTLCGTLPLVLFIVCTFFAGRETLESEGPP